MLLTYTLSLYSAKSVVASHSAFFPAASFIDTFTLFAPIFLSRCISPSKCLCRPPHNHLTPLRASAETSFTPLSSLRLQVLLALTRWPLSNQHLLGFIPLSSAFPSWLSSFLYFARLFFCLHVTISHFPISPL